MVNNLDLIYHTNSYRDNDHCCLPKIVIKLACHILCSNKSKDDKCLRRLTGVDCYDQHRYCTFFLEMYKHCVNQCILKVV